MEEIKVPYKRNLSIDRFRGFIVFCMIFFIGAADFPVLGIIARVANNSTTGNFMIMDGMSLADIVSPAFLFLISLSYKSSFERRYEKNKKDAYIHFILRYIIFMGFGSIIVSCEDFFVNHLKDPFIIQTILMFVVFITCPLYYFLLLFKKIPQKVKDILKYTYIVSLIILAIIDIVLGIYDDALLLLGYKSAYRHWSIMDKIGLTGLLCLPYIRLDLKERIISFSIISTLYAVVQLIPNAVKLFDIIVLGGFIGAFGWVIVMIAGSILIELFDKDKFHLKYLVFALVIGIIGIILSNLCVVNSSAITLNFLFISIFISALLFWVANLFSGINTKFKFLIWWGRNPLIIFIIGLVLRLFQLLWNPAPDTPLWIALIATFGPIIILTIIAYNLYKKSERKYIS